ncbi:MAG TPA: diacylglycerol kinase family protein [Longimicrobium sp.]|jgi:diacylglycerol kinase family enzyme
MPTPTGPEPIPAFVNPGGGNARAAAEALAGDARFAPREVEPGELGGAVAAEVARGARRVLVAGGDGTVAAAAARVLGSGVELAVLPAGTLNHFARGHGIPLSADEALELAAAGTARAVDVGTVCGRVFLNTSSVGAYVGFVRRRERLERFLPYRAASLAAAAAVYLRLRTFDVEVEAEGRTRRYRTAVVFVGVGERELRFPSFGGRAEGGREGLHLIAVEGKARLVALALKAVARGLDEVARSHRVDSFMVERCTVHMPKPLGYLALDGETCRMPSPFEYRLARGALRVVAPPVQPQAPRGEGAE